VSTGIANSTKIMKIACSTNWLAVLLSLSICVNSAFAQEPEETDAPEVPELNSLVTGWWTYFEGTQDEVEPRIALFLEGMSSGIAALSPTNQVIGEAMLRAVRENLTAYLALLDDTLPAPPAPSPEAESYSIDELLELASIARNARTVAEYQRGEVEREQQILDGTERRRDASFRSYVDAGGGDERWLAGARRVLARSAQAISQRRLELLTESYERTSESADMAASRVEMARQRLATAADVDALNDLIDVVSEKEAAVTTAEETLRAAEVAAIGLDLDTPQGRSQQRLQQQIRVSADVNLALAKASLGKAQAHRWWAELKLDAALDTAVLEEQALGWSELVRSIRQQEPEWQRETEDELLAAQSVSREGLDRESRRLLDQRLGTAAETLARVGELESSAGDLELLSMVVDDAVAEYSGRFSSWLSSLIRKIKGGLLRIGDLSGYTLFSVGETPVTGKDVLWVIVILTAAFLLSRGIRYAINRVTQKDFSGTQASLYTLGRLTHYTIIIFAVFLALSSIGLDFSNLALVAGALSVGIGFGLQSIVSNFVSGLIILFEHTLRVGDFIELDTGLRGNVKAINVRSTLINTNDNIDIVVPNSEFVTSRLTNWTLGERILRMRIPFGVAYGSDKELVRKAALEAADAVQYTLTNMPGREPNVWLMEFGDNSLNFVLLAWVNRQGARRPSRTRAAYMWELESKLAEYGIEIPFPQRDLHLRSGWPRETPSAEVTKAD
jgi:small-conductance mechanosensitive channel